MRLVSVETTPNPNSMKLNFDTSLGAAITYTTTKVGNCPEFVERLLEIAELRSIFVCGDFITLNKDPRADWRAVLDKATLILSGKQNSATMTVAAPHDSSASTAATSTSSTSPTKDVAAGAQTSSFVVSNGTAVFSESEGQVHVFVQTFRGIPIQVKVVDSQGEDRISLGQRFNDVASSVQLETGANFLLERYWADHGLRYGSRIEVANELAEELQGIFDGAALERVKTKAVGHAEVLALSLETIMEWLQHDDWHRRLNAVFELGSSVESIPLLINSLQDPHPQVRRMTAAALGATGSDLVVQPLCDVLINDPSPGVRRTAGDALSDIAAIAAQDAICKALADPNKLVRWRAARFLFELGSKEALPFLEKAVQDSAFEVQLEVNAAIHRISDGLETMSPAWKRIVGDN